MIEMNCYFGARRAFQLLVLALLLPVAASAQADPGLVKHRDDCRLAAQVLTKGEPADKTAWARGFIVSCNDDAPAALASWVRNARRTTDREELNRLFAAALVISDDGVFNAAVDVAEDEQATLNARVAGLLIASMQLRDQTTFDFDDIMASSVSTACTFLPLDHSMRAAAGAPISTSSRARLAALANRLVTAPGSPIPVVNAARCASQVLGR